MQCNCKCISLVTSFPSHQVSIFTHTHSVYFSAFSLCDVTPACPHHDIKQKWCSVAPAAIYCAPSAPAPDKIGRKGGKGEILWAHTYPTVSSRPRGRRVQSLVPIGSEMWICIRYKQIYIQTFIFIYEI
jgi:hypothetical protein